ncbi:MAG: glycosyltransferase [Acidimicrobiales bacterium]
MSEPAPLRVLHVLEAVRGGTLRYVLDVVSATPGTEHHVALPSRQGLAGRSGAMVEVTGADELEARGAEVHTVDMRRNPLHPANARAVASVTGLISELEPAVVHGHSSVGGAVARVAATGWSLPGAPFGLRARRALRTVPAAFTPNGLMTSAPAVAFERLFGPLTSRLIAVSASEGSLAVDLGLVPADRVRVIPNGIELLCGGEDGPAVGGGRGVAPVGAARRLAAPGRLAAAGRLRTQLGLPAGTPLIGTIARMVPQKAPEAVLAAWGEVARRRPHVHFVWIGLGPRQRSVTRCVAREGLGRRFHQIPHLAGAASAVGEFDALVLLSRYEGGPYVPLEAMRAGVPVVLSDVVGNRDTVESGVTGFLVPFGDAAAAADAIVGLLDDRHCRRAIVAAASERLRRDFGVQLMGERLAALYREMAVAGPSARVARIPTVFG